MKKAHSTTRWHLALALLLVVAWGLSACTDSEPGDSQIARSQASPHDTSPATAPPEPAQPLDGQIIVDPDHPRWFRYAGGGPFFMCGPGDPEDFLYRGTRQPDGTRDGDQEQIIAKLAASGANCLYMQIVRSHGGDGSPDHNPFVDSDPDGPLDTDILDQWDHWFQAMDDAGIVTFLMFYDDGACIWDCNAGSDHAVRAAELAFVQNIVDRFEHLRHLIWVVAEEYQESFSPERIAAVAHAIREADDHDHPTAVHKLSGFSFGEFADDPSIDQFAVQSPHLAPRALHEALVTAGDTSGGRYNLNMSEMADHGTGRDARLRNWAAAMAGAYVMVYPWDVATTDDADLRGCGILRRFMESTTIDRFVSRDDLAAGDTEYVLSTPAETGPLVSSSGTSAILYASEARATLGMHQFAGARAHLRWLDPVSGDTANVPDVRVETDEDGTALFPLPSGWQGEVALYVRGSGREVP